MEFKKWTYNKKSWEVIPSTEIVTPNCFVKYYDISDYSIDALVNSYLYFSHPLILNDPFDSCRQFVSLDNFSKRMLTKLVFKNQEFAFTKNTQKKDYKEIEYRVEQLYNSDREGLLDYSLTLYWNLIFKNWGILSLSDNDSDMRMWSYYNKHQGFIVKLKRNIFNQNEVKGPFPIHYSDDNTYETIKPTSNKIDNDQLLYVTNVKSSVWGHENEWRFLVNRNNMSIPDYKGEKLNDNLRKIPYSKDTIDCIILGYKFFQENIADEYLGEGIHSYIFHPESSDKYKAGREKRKLNLLDFALKYDIPLKQAEIIENNKFELEIVDMELECEIEKKRYIVKSNYRPK